jgi:hypothetical protein
MRLFALRGPKYISIEPSELRAAHHADRPAERLLTRGIRIVCLMPAHVSSKIPIEGAGFGEAECQQRPN